MAPLVQDTSSSWEKAPSVEVDSPLSPIDNGTSAVPPSHAWSSRIWHSYADQQEALKNPSFPSYGRHGTETTLALEKTLSHMQGMDETMLCASGTQANSLALQAVAKRGEHLLIPENAYENTRDYANYLRDEHGVEITFYDPQLSPEELGKLLRPETTGVFMETPSSITLECADVKGFAEIIRAHERAHGSRVYTIADATYLTPSSEFLPELGVDVVTHSLTKYPNGTSNIFLGSVSSNDKTFMERAHKLHALAGNHAAPESAHSILASIQHMVPRVQKSAQNAVEIVNHIQNKAGVKRILHPGNPEHAGHKHWKTQLQERGNGLFTVEFDRQLSEKEMRSFCNASGIGLGYSWGGTESIQMPAHLSGDASARTKAAYQGTLIRFHIGHENIEELKQRFDAAFTALEKQQQRDAKPIFGRVTDTWGAATRTLTSLMDRFRPANDNPSTHRGAANHR